MCYLLGRCSCLYRLIGKLINSSMQMMWVRANVISSATHCTEHECAVRSIWGNLWSFLASPYQRSKVCFVNYRSFVPHRICNLELKTTKKLTPREMTIYMRQVWVKFFIFLFFGKYVTGMMPWHDMVTTAQSEIVVWHGAKTLSYRHGKVGGVKLLTLTRAFARLEKLTERYFLLVPRKFKNRIKCARKVCSEFCVTLNP